MGQIVAFVIAANLIAEFVYLGIVQATFDRDERLTLLTKWDAVIGYLLYSLFVVLLLCVLTLIRRLKQMRDHVFKDDPEQRHVFDREIRTLWCIMTVFNFTYLLRGIWNQLHLP